MPKTFKISPKLHNFAKLGHSGNSKLIDSSGNNEKWLIQIDVIIKSILGKLTFLIATYLGMLKMPDSVLY